MSNTFKTIAAELGELVTAKNLAYGNSFAKCGGFLRLLYPNGIHPDQYEDCLCMCRIFDKQMRIATHKTALGESPYKDIAGYGILGIAKDQEMAERGAFLNGAVHGEEHPFDLVAKGELPPAFGPMIPDGVTEVGAVRGEDGGIHPRTAECALFAPVCAGSDCNRCSSFTLKAELRKTVVDVVADTAKDPAPHPADLLPVFALIAKEHSRSLEEHTPWEQAGHSPDTMLAVIKAELAEVELALSMGDYAETVKELVHVANVAVKAISGLTRSGTL